MQTITKVKGALLSAILLIASPNSCWAQKLQFNPNQLAAILLPQSSHPTFAVDLIDSLQESDKDSLIYKRGILFGKMYRKGIEIKQKNVENLLKNYQNATKKYRLGNTLRPIGPIVSFGGITLGYIAIKGKSASVFVEGKNYNYTIRSMPKLVAGIGALVGGLCLIEWSHELFSDSADLFNAQLGKKKKVDLFQTIKLGITPNGNVGLFAKF